MPEIPNGVASIEDVGQIPKTVAELAQETDISEMKPYLISFERYNDDHCEIEHLQKNKGKKALSILKEIGTKVYTRADFQRNNIKTCGIAKNGAYKSLYNGLADDIEVRELYLQDTGRIFYFDIEPDRLLYIVAITENHLETNQVRR